MTRMDREDLGRNDVENQGQNASPTLGADGRAIAEGRQGRSRRGFAAMDPEQHREISRRGGQASHESGRGHEWNEEEAREAGRRGGEARWRGRGRNEEPQAHRIDNQDRRGLAR